MTSLTSRDLLKELNNTSVNGSELRYFLEKLLKRMIEIEDVIIAKIEDNNGTK